MIEEIVAQRVELERLRAAFGKTLKVGRVAQVDAVKGYRIELGKTSKGAPFLSPWMPHPESGGQSASWIPMSEGQIVGVLAPAGDMRQGILVRAGFGGGNDAPSDDLAANVFAALGVNVSIRDGDLVLKGNLKVEGNVDFSQGHVRHNATNIGDDHKHKDVTAGGDKSGKPE